MSAMMVRAIGRPTAAWSVLRTSFPRPVGSLRVLYCSFSYTPIRCKASDSGAGGGKKAPSRLAQMQELMNEAKEKALSAGNEPIPKITLDHVVVSFARSGGPGGQNVNKVNTKVDMRFNVKNAHWLCERVRQKIMQMEKNRINKDGEVVISSTKTRMQKGNIEDALAKLQAIIDAASYVPPPPSQEQIKKISQIAAIGDQKRLHNKKLFHIRKRLDEARTVMIDPLKKIINLINI